MMTSRGWYVVALVIVCLAPPSESYAAGAPSNQCGTMTPSHGVVGQTSASPYTLTFASPAPTKYKSGTHIQVKVTGGDYKGILLQARKQGSTTPLGTFRTPPGATKLMQCTAADDSITHSNASAKTDTLVFEWDPPCKDEGTVEFVAVIVQSKATWWNGIKSAALTFDSTGVACPTTPAPAPTQAQTTQAQTPQANTTVAGGKNGGKNGCAELSYSVALLLGTVVMAGRGA